MQKCKVTNAVTIHSGIFKLDKNQVKRRLHMLKKVKAGIQLLNLSLLRRVKSLNMMALLIVRLPLCWD